jgi:hypothetical protein
MYESLELNSHLQQGNSRKACQNVGRESEIKRNLECI